MKLLATELEAGERKFSRCVQVVKRAGSRTGGGEKGDLSIAEMLKTETLTGRMLR